MLDVLALLEVAVDVLDGHGGVVDQDADREREAAERHDVDASRRAPRAGDRASEDRERDRNGDDQRRAPAAEKQQDHQAGQRGGDEAFADDAGDRGVDEDRLIADAFELQDRAAASPRSRGSASLMPAMMSSVEAEPIFRIDISTARLPVQLHDIGLRRRAVMDVGDVAHEDDRAVDRLDRQVVEILAASSASR